jgi:hypothetical protein
MILFRLVILSQARSSKLEPMTCVSTRQETLLFGPARLTDDYS